MEHPHDIIGIMELIVVYGPPAVGKLTVAHELAKRTSARLLDILPVATTVTQAIGQNNPQFTPLVYSLQLQILNAAMRFGTQDIIATVTFTVSSKADVALLQTIAEAGKAHNVTVQFIYLTARKRVLLERVQQESRRAAGKTTDPQFLQNYIDQNDVGKPAPGLPGITINTTHLTAPEVAEQILRNISAH